MTRVVCLGVLVFSLIAVCGCSASKESYVSKGNKLFAAGKYQDAALNYRAAIQKDTTYGEAHYRLGLAAVKLEQGRQAYSSLLRAMQLLPANIQVKKDFADLCLGLYLADPSHSQLFYTQIQNLAGEFLSQDRNSYEGLMLKGYLASTDRKPKEAIQYFRAALRVNASNDGVVTELAHLLIQDGQAQAGEELAAGLIVRKKTSYGPAYDLLYSFYLNANQPARAENILVAKANNNPKNADYVLQLARHYNRLRKPFEMAGAVARLLNNPKDFPQARVRIGDFYLSVREYAEAIRYYQEGAKAAGDVKTKAVYQIRNVLALLDEGKREEAVDLAKQFRRENPADTGILRLHADLVLASGKTERADAVVREFQTLSAQSPGDTSLRMQLARAFRLKSDLDGARKQFLEVIHQRRDSNAARYELAEIALLQHRPQEAAQQAGEILAAQPNDRRASLLYASGLIATGDTETARGVLTRLVKDFPQDSEPQIQMGLLALAERNFPKAIDVLNRHRAGGDARVFAALGNAYVNQRDFDRARTILQEGLGKWPSSSILQEQLAGAEALSGHYDLALAQYQKLLLSDPKSIALRRRLAEVCDFQGDHARALHYYQEAHQMAPGDVALTVSLGDALERANRVSEARALYQDLAKAHPENAPAMNNVAFYLADTGGDLDEALRLAKSALARTPGQPSFSDTVGYIYLKKGMLDSAIQSFSTLAHRYPASASFHYHLGLALIQKGDKAVARKELQAALANHPSPRETLQIRELLHEIS